MKDSIWTHAVVLGAVEARINHRSFRFIDLHEIKHRYLINWLVHNENKGWKEKEPAETEKLVNNLSK